MSQDAQQKLIPRSEDGSFLRWTGRISAGMIPASHQNVGYEPQMGHEGDLLRVTLVLRDMSLLPDLYIAIGSCIAPTVGRVVMDEASSSCATSLVVELTAPVPNAEWTEEENRERVPLRVVICNHAENKILDHWFVGYFVFESTTLPQHRKWASLGVNSPLIASTDNSSADGGGLGLLSGGAKRARTSGPHLYPHTYQGGKPGSEVVSPTIDMSQEHGASTAMAGQSDPIRYDVQDPETATKVMVHSSFHNPSAEADESQHPDTSINTSASVSYNPAIADMDLFLNSSGLGTGEHQGLHSYVMSPPGALQAATATFAGVAITATTTTTPGEGGGQQQLQSSYQTFTYSDYDRLPYKANLRFESDLDAMMQNWTLFEMERQRRLVRFWRQQQQSSDILCSFAPIDHDEQPDQAMMTVVSCIYWREAGDYFITSVDCIYLLENLLGAHFTNEEKNRVRRNFEAFRPQTISRLRPESAAFFRLVMDFPPPKPRTIEKDLKMLPWRCLASALQKIVRKYQPSYSSTASINLSGLAAASSMNDLPTPSSRPLI